jgi:DNA adenine methylase
LISCAAALSRSTIAIEGLDFGAAVSTAQEGDLVFFDPPYVTGHNNNGFVDYNETLFRWKDQVRLASVARDLADRGVTVIVTNALHPSVVDLYRGFCVKPMERKSTLAGNARFRTDVTEALFWSGDH